MRSVQLLCLLCLLCLSPASAAPAPTGAAARVEQARRHWRDLEFERVLEASDRALAEADPVGRHHAAALWLKGSALVVLGRRALASSVFEELLALDPDYLPSEEASPRVLSVFNPTRASWQVREQQRLLSDKGSQLRSVALSITAPPVRAPPGPIEIVARLVDPGALVASLTLHYRRRGQPRYASVRNLVRPGATTLVIPGALSASPSGYALDYFVIARHRSGVALRSAGSAERPLSVIVNPAPRTPLARRWELWVSVAAVAASAVAIPLAVVYGRELGVQNVVIRRAP